jgi:hypothetical protein
VAWWDFMSPSGDFDYGSLGQESTGPSLDWNTPQFNFQPQRSRGFDFASIFGGGDDSYAGSSQISRRPTSIYDQYIDHLSNMPNRQNYERGNWGKLGAAIGGATTAFSTRDPRAGMAFVDDFMNDPYERAVGDWTNKGKQLSILADDERQRDQQRFTMRKAAIDAGQKDEELNLRKQEVRSQIESRNSTNEYNKARTRKLLDDIDNPDVDVVKSNDGSWYGIDKKGKVVKNYGKVDISQSEMDNIRSKNDIAVGSALESQRQKNRIGLEGVQNTNRVENAKTRFSQEKELEGVRQGNRKELKAVPSPNMSGVNSEEFGKRQEAAVSKVFRNPLAANQGWEKFFKKDEQTGANVLDENAVRSNPTKWEQFQKAVKLQMQQDSESYRRGY